MSQDRDTALGSGAGPAMCRKQPGHKYVPLYMGSQREPRRADEVGAIAVVRLLFGGRVVLYPHNADWLRVVRLD